MTFRKGLFKRTKGKEVVRRQIDIPLDDGQQAAACHGGPDISNNEFAFIDRHHEEYKELRRRARKQGGC